MGARPRPLPEDPGDGALRVPRPEVRIAGGREMHLRSLQGLALHVANSIFLGDYLTSEGQAAETDLELIRDNGFVVLGSDEHDAQIAAAPLARPGHPSARRRHSRRRPTPDRVTADLLDWDRAAPLAPLHLDDRRRPRPGSSPAPRASACDGRRLATPIDAMASWWSAIHGYRHPVLDAAVRDQLDDFSARDVRRADPRARDPPRAATRGARPRRARRTSSSPTAGRSASRSRSRWRCSTSAAPAPGRTRLLTVRGGYHGDTFGAMSVCDPEGGMHSMFRGFVPEQVFAPRPPGARRADRRAGPRACRALADRARRRARRRSSSSRCCRAPAACTPTRPSACRVMREVADEHGLVLIFDEIATGFGRTGHHVRRGRRRRTTRHHVRRQGAHRRLPHARRGPVHRRDRARAVALRGRRADARSDLHGQPARLRGRARLARAAARAPTGRRTIDRHRRSGWPRASRRRASCPACPTYGSSAPSASSSSTARSTWSPRPTRHWRPGCGCGRSATSSTRCRPTSAPTTRSTRSARRCSQAAEVG